MARPYLEEQQSLQKHRGLVVEYSAKFILAMLANPANAGESAENLARYAAALAVAWIEEAQKQIITLEAKSLKT